MIRILIRRFMALALLSELVAIAAFENIRLVATDMDGTLTQI